MLIVSQLLDELSEDFQDSYFSHNSSHVHKKRHLRWVFLTADDYEEMLLNPGKDSNPCSQFFTKVTNARINPDNRAYATQKQ